MIDQIYIKIISDIRFVEKKFFKKDLDNQIFVVLGKIDREDFILKITSAHNTQKVETFLKEKNFCNFLKKTVFDKKFNFTEVIQSGNENGYFWILRRFYSGRSLSEYKGKIPLMGYDIISKNFLLNKKDIIKKIVDQHKILESISKNEYLNYFKHEPQKRYKDVELYPLEQVSDYLNIDLAKQIEFYKTNKMAYYNRESLQSCDLVPGNILLLKDKRVVISDLEFICFENNMLDYACLWLYLWRLPKWQKCLIDKVINNKEDQIDFAIGVFRIIIACYGYKIEQQSDLSGYKDHIWAKYLKNSDSYEKLISI